MKFPELIKSNIYPTVFYGTYIIPDMVKPRDVFIKYPIEWFVLEMDSQKKKALLLSKYIIDWEGFADCPVLGSGYKTSWDKSYLRSWLNGEFFNECFSEEERRNISTIYIAANGTRSQHTMDKIFLLSDKDVKKYFTDEETAIAFQPMVIKAVSGTEGDPIVIGSEPEIWWTRTIGTPENKVICVDWYGSFCEKDSNCDEIGVRPAMWVSFD